ncbi:hypothetical protein TU94_30935 [Streptomyces cyaneogriseus subsp. noncyanogenus]|uniref:Uncharacterized protein n=1 Tax=Streptomyces cyaneogriseus subsp. noncyanogenus TaxID=477245 RepID=A0A0C5G5D3_9ACTN|nr:hypothetical protein [Streptomyces cyaneogriseus]AJP05183.1 hypothetical protein TU94_30935 [Streptomyces cyaneogriseus subsp. noncyanogenus]
MSRILRVFTVGVLIASATGYAATEYITRTVPAPTPPSPYGTEPPPPDCREPEKLPADCPVPGDGCPARDAPDGSGRATATATPKPPPHPAATAWPYTPPSGSPEVVQHLHVCVSDTLVAYQ